MDRRERTDDLLVAVRAALRGWQAGIWTALPGKVETYDAVKRIAAVQPMIQVQLRSEQGVWSNQTLPLCPDCPVIFPGAGGFSLTFPVQQGDEGFLIFASRCLDAAWQQGGVQPQAEVRLHDLSDGVFLPFKFSQPNMPAASATAARLSNADGSNYIELGPAGVKIKGNLDIEGNTTFAGSVSGGGAPGADLIINGAATFTGEVTALFGTPQSVKLSTHLHTSGGAGNPTSAPTPGT